MKKIYIKYLSIGTLILMGIVLFPQAHRLARAHVNSKTAVEDHPLKCTSCHLYTHKTGLMSKLVNADYYSPLTMAVSGDGKRLYVVAEEGDALLIVDADKHKVEHKVSVGNHPHSVVLDREEKKAYVSNQWSDNVSVIDLSDFIIESTLKTGNGPAGLALSTDGKSLYVVNSYSSDITVIDLSSGEERKRLSAGNNPTGIQSSPDGSRLYVTSRRTMGKPYDDTVRCELTIIDDKMQKVVERRDIMSAHIMENIAFTPSGDLAIIPLIRPKNNVPSIQVERGWMMNHGIGILELKPGGRLVQLLLDEPNAFFADPFDIAISADGKKAFVSHGGADCISVIDIDAIRVLLSTATDAMLSSYANHLGISSRYVIKRIPTGANPKGLAMSSDGSSLYVVEHLEDRVSVISTESLEIRNTIDLGGPKRITHARQGKKLFNNSGHTFQNQYACYTCHPDEHEDGLVYNMASREMGRNLANTQSLRDIGDTPPFKWNGKNQTVYKQDGMRFSTVLTRTEPFSYDDLDALVAHIITGIPYPPNTMYNPTGEMNAMQLRGKEIFERTSTTRGKEIPVENRCITCHPPPYYTNLKMAYVGTLAATDDSMLLDTPHLNNVYASSPYLHDGRARTLEEIWTKYSPRDQHGVANDLSKIQLNELIEYLKALSSPDYQSAVSRPVQAKITTH